MLKNDSYFALGSKFGDESTLNVPFTLLKITVVGILIANTLS